MLEILIPNNWVAQLLRYSPGKEEQIGSWKMSFRPIEFEVCGTHSNEMFTSYLEMCLKLLRDQGYRHRFGDYCQEKTLGRLNKRDRTQGNSIKVKQRKAPVSGIQE